MAPASTPFYSDLGALRCVASGFGDIAFVDYRQLTGSGGEFAPEIEPSGFRVLCRNGSLASTLGLNVDDDCALSTGVSSQVVARADRSATRNTELTELLLQIDSWFGSTSPSKLDSTFHVYSEFQGKKDLLFKDSSRRLILPNDNGFSNVNRYKKLQEQNNVCIKNRSSAMSTIPSVVLVIPFILGHLCCR